MQKTQTQKLSALVTEEESVQEPEDELEEARCCICDETRPARTVNDVFSNAFTGSSRLNAGDAVCWRCEYMAQHKEQRRYHWIATESGGLETTKDRELLLETLLNPPDEPWMMQIVSDFLNVLNGWTQVQDLNLSTERYRIVRDRDPVHLERDKVRELTEFARDLRDDSERDNKVAKRVMNNGAGAHDIDYYDLSWGEKEQIDEYIGREDWNLVVKLVQ